MTDAAAITEIQVKSRPPGPLGPGGPGPGLRLGVRGRRRRWPGDESRSKFNLKFDFKLWSARDIPTGQGQNLS